MFCAKKVTKLPDLTVYNMQSLTLLIRIEARHHLQEIDALYIVYIRWQADNFYSCMDNWAVIHSHCLVLALQPTSSTPLLANALAYITWKVIHLF
jgi:hypothetical protein